MNIEVDITRECDLKCPCCNRLCNIYPKNQKSIMTLDEIKNIISQIKNSKEHIHQFRLIGGEPTSHKELYEICDFISKNINVDVYTITTNCVKSDSKYNLLQKIKKNTKFVYKSNEPNVKFKFNKHINIYNTSKCIQKEKYSDCVVLNRCGINVYKFNNEIKWSWCSCVSYISRLLKIEDKVTYSSFNELLNSNINDTYKNICKYCAFYEKSFGDKFPHALPFHLNNEISDIFKDGLEYIKSHKEEYNNE